MSENPDGCEFKPLQMPAAAKKNKFSQFGPFADVVREYSNAEYDGAKVDLSCSREISDLVCAEGFPEHSVNAHELNWRTGIDSLFDYESLSSVTWATERHRQVCFELYKKWNLLDDSDYANPKYGRSESAVAKPSDTSILQALPIYDRESLSKTYVDLVLRTYLRALIECQSILWRDLKNCHACGAWLMYQPARNGRYSLRHPKQGFDGHGNYQVELKVYARGFELDPETIDAAYYPNVGTYAEQENWLFLSAEEVLALDSTFSQKTSPRIERTKNSRRTNKKNPVNPVNAAFERADKKWVLKILELFWSGAEMSINRATEIVVQENQDKIIEKTTSDRSKCDRLRKKAKAAEGLVGHWADDEELSELIQKYPKRSED